MAIRRASSQILSLHAGRGIASLMVVVLHAASYVSADTRYWNRPDLFHYFLGLHLGVEYFFVLSGTVILLAHRKDIGLPQRVPAYFWKRFRRIYPVYWLVLTAVVLEYVLRPGLGAAYQSNPLVILSGYLLVHVGTMDTNLPIAWTLFLEILFYAMFASLLLSKRWGTVLLTAWGMGCVSQIFWPGRPFFGWYLFSPLNLLFLFGMAASRWVREDRVRYPKVLIGLGGLAFAGAYLGCALPVRQTCLIEFSAGIGAALLISGCSALERAGAFSVPKWLEFQGAASYSVYLIHYPFLMGMAPLVFRLSQRHNLPWGLAIALMVVTATAVGCLFHVLVERPLLRWLSGQRTIVPALEQLPLAT